MILQAFPATLMLSGIFLLVTKTSHFCLKSKKKFPLVILLSWKIRILQYYGVSHYCQCFLTWV